MKPITRRGFTLIELLVVVAIIALLLAILVPALSGARTQAKRSRVAAQLQVISVGLHAFANDMGDFPTSDPFSGDPMIDPNYMPTGAHILAMALVGTPGGMTPLGNKKPYLAVDKSGARRADNPEPQEWGMFPCGPFPPSLTMYVLRDLSYGSPILYYRANRRAKYSTDLDVYRAVEFSRQSVANSQTQAAYYLSDNAMITGTDNAFPTALGNLGPFTGWLWSYTGQDADRRFNPSFRNEPRLSPEYVNVDRRLLFADYIEIEGSRMVPQTEPIERKRDVLSARVQNSEDFLLITAGPDHIFGPRKPGVGMCDDIANFTVPTTGP